jgi:hypothetical protein
MLPIALDPHRSATANDAASIRWICSTRRAVRAAAFRWWRAWGAMGRTSLVIAEHIRR